MKLTILKYGNPILRKKSVNVTDFNCHLNKLSYDMIETMHSNSGIGLAAPQIGILLRICVVDISSDKKKPLIMINPKIISNTGSIYNEEGCLSLPGFFGFINRHKKMIVEFFDLECNIKELELNGLLARVVQHEIDHLDAKMFIDYLSDVEKNIIFEKINNKKKEGNW
ncbi:MAG: peptide deformylase [Endomicrobium sp.]|jgi:peptide deformylase|nr:peptide deformylase [Endomicrobium sp.]